MRAKIFLGVGFAALGCAFAIACSSSDSSTSSDGGSDSAAPTHANGTVGDFKSATDMPKPRANHCAVATNGYLIVIGGNYSPDPTSANPSFTNLDEVDAAKINPDGSVGDWSMIGHTPSPVNSCTAAAHGDTIYLLDGIYDDESKEGHVYSASIDTSGSLGDFTAIGDVPPNSDLFDTTAWIDGDDSAPKLHVFNAYLPHVVTDDAGNDLIDDGGNFVIDDGGAITIFDSPVPSLSWSENPFLDHFVGHPQLAYTDDYVYAMGGYSGAADGGPPDLSSQVNAASRKNGSIGATFGTTELTKPTMFGDAVAVDGYIFLVGGRADIFGNEARTEVLSAKINADGTIGAWGTQTSMPQGRTDMRITAYGDFIYVTGGGDDGPGLSSVFYARVRF